MSDTIYRQAAIDKFWELDVEMRPTAIWAVFDMLKSLPSAEPERKKGKGKWIKHDDEMFGLTYECSNCHVEGMINGNYCPNCGADMRGKEGLWGRKTYRMDATARTVCRKEN